MFIWYLEGVLQTIEFIGKQFTILTVCIKIILTLLGQLQ